MMVTNRMCNQHGHCLCGQVSFTVAQLSEHLGACHCSMCRRWGGGPLLAVDCGTEVRFDNEQLISVYSSSERAERGFCSHCGTHLFYRLKGTGEYVMPAALFDTDELIFESQIFIDEKPGYYDFANSTKMMTGAEVFAMYAPEQGADDE